MQFFSGANRLERIRRRRVASGELIDVTNDALHHGIADTVCISKRLWSSLIQPFPFAEPGDCLSLSALLVTLKIHLSASRFGNAHALLLLPPHVPKWCGARCFLKVLVNSPAGGPRSMVLQPFSDPLPVCAPRLDDSLPASLLLRTAETLRGLAFISRTSEHGSARLNAGRRRPTDTVKSLSPRNHCPRNRRLPRHIASIPAR